MIIEKVFEKKQTIMTYTVEELTEMLQNERLILRETNKVQVRMIRKYIIDNIMTGDIYMPPLVALVSDGRLLDEKVQSLIIIDGSHRLKALLQLESMITKLINSEDELERKKGFQLHYSIADVELCIQVFEGLTTTEMDQLYIDLNTKGKKVALSKRIAYDSRNVINIATNRFLENNKAINIAGIEMEKSAVMRPHNKKLLSLSQLRTIVSLFVFGKHVTNRLPIMKEIQDELFNERFKLIEVWFEELFTLYKPESIGDYNKSMLASFPLLLALAHYALLGESEVQPDQKEKYIRLRMKKLSHIDWSRDQQIWQQFNGSIRGREKFYYLNNDKKTFNALIAWLCSEGGG